MVEEVTVGKLKEHFRGEQGRIVEEWSTLLKFPSISTDPLHDHDCRSCASWLAAHLSSLGFKVELVETAGKPLLCAELERSSSAPTVAFYGHYDVQPVDPLEFWQSKPFEPQLRDGRMYARGAQDNKGQLFFFVKGVEALLRLNALPVNLKLFIEGEEESGSKGILQVLPEISSRLKSDILMVCDTGCESLSHPAVTMGIRGLVHLTVAVKGLKKDLHSGQHGGVVKNPALELLRLLATLHDSQGKVTVAEFYEGVEGVDPKDKALANEAPFDLAEYLEQVGVPPSGGESGFSPAERRGFRPTIEVNGVHSGYDGPGSKTIIPATAFAKLTCRLVGRQDPERTLERVVSHLTNHAPKDLVLEIPEKGVGGPALLMSVNAPAVQRAREVLDELSGGKTTFLWEGGSIPVVAALAREAKAAPLLVGFGLEKDNIHAPNESFGLDQFEMGYLYVARLLNGLKDVP